MTLLPTPIDILRLLPLLLATVLSVSLFSSMTAFSADAIDDETKAAIELDSQGEREAAERAYRALLVDTPSNLIAANNLAILMVRGANFDEADEILSRAIELDKGVIKVDERVTIIALFNRNGLLATFYRVQPAKDRPADILSILQANKRELNK